MARRDLDVLALGRDIAIQSGGYIIDACLLML